MYRMQSHDPTLETMRFIRGGCRHLGKTYRLQVMCLMIGKGVKVYLFPYDKYSGTLHNGSGESMPSVLHYFLGFFLCLSGEAEQGNPNRRMQFTRSILVKGSFSLLCDALFSCIKSDCGQYQRSEQRSALKAMQEGGFRKVTASA